MLGRNQKNESTLKVLTEELDAKHKHGVELEEKMKKLVNEKEKHGRGMHGFPSAYFDMEWADKRSYCLLCRADFVSSRPKLCKTHYRPIQGGVWQCCKEKDPTALSDGCIRIPHHFVDVCGNQAALTDGRTVLLSWGHVLSD